jgi:hypothetical protein
MRGVLVLGDIAGWHIAVVFKRHAVPPACSLIRVEAVGIGLMNRPSDSTSTPWTGNTLFGFMANLLANEKAITRLSMRPRSNPSSMERRYGNPDASA